MKPTEGENRPFRIRSFVAADRQAVRDICAVTCWMGSYRPELIGDDWIWAEYWTRYFTDVEPGNAFIMERCEDGKIVGYLTGTADERRFLRYAWRIMPGIVAHTIRRRLMRQPVARRALLAMAKSAIFDETCPRQILDRYPATWHFDILPEGRMLRGGPALVQAFFSRLKDAGIRGVHGEILSVNRGLGVYLKRGGFELAHRRKTRAFAHAENDPVEILTYVREL